MSPFLQLGIAGFLLVTTALLAAAETVLERVSLVRALRLDDEEAPGAEALLWLMEHRTTGRNAVLVATVAVRVVFAALVLLAADELGLAPATVALLVAVLLSLVVGEVAPRTWVLRHLEATALRLAPSLRLLVRVLDPVARLVVDAGRLLVRTRREVPGPYPTDEEMRDLLAEEDADEPIPDDERAMITSILELGDTVVREIMVPRPDMVTVEADAELREVIETVIDHGRSRIPVRRGSGDAIVGVVHAKDVLARLATRPGSGQWSDLVRPAHFVPETKRVDRLLSELRDEAIHQAIVVDEYGAVTGLVTIEDVLEEIVGEIVDEHDDEAPLVEVLDGGRLRVDARLPVGDLEELLSAELPAEDWDTVGGLVFGIIGHVPDEGEHVELQGLRFVAERVQGRRVAHVLVERLPEPIEEPA